MTIIQPLPDNLSGVNRIHEPVQYRSVFKRVTP